MRLKYFIQNYFGEATKLCVGNSDSSGKIIIVSKNILYGRNWKVGNLAVQLPPHRYHGSKLFSLFL